MYDDVSHLGIDGDIIGKEGSTGIYVQGMKSSQEHELERLCDAVEGLRITWFARDATENRGLLVSKDANIWIPKVAMGNGSRGCGPLEGVLARVLNLPPGNVVDAVLLLDRFARSLDKTPDRVVDPGWMKWNLWNAWCTTEQLQRGIDACLAIGRGHPIEADAVACMLA